MGSWIAKTPRHQDRKRRIFGESSWRRGVLAIFSAAGCTAIVDRTSAQCHTDADCAHFGGHPYCQNSVCVSSGLAPADCYYGTPQTPAQFDNQCTLAACVAFD